MLLPQSFVLPVFRWSSRSSRSIKSRTLFSLPDLTSLSGFSPEPQTYHERKILPYGQKQLYDIVSDVPSYPKFVPFCTGSRIVKSPVSQPGARVGKLTETVMEAELTVGFMVFQEKYVSTVTCIPYEAVEAVASSSTPLFKTLSTTWRFAPASPQSPHFSTNVPHSKSQDLPTAQAANCPTLVTLDLAFEFANPLHASVSSTFFGQVSKLMVKAFEERCMAVYGPGSK